ncbi:MAG: glucosaminidase domain-containing protein, partial [bacterium]|nr:glucosaminidase domain-containing protein [bacterium]
ENYKEEILINKKTGEMVTIDEPTFIDTNKYDVVGEKTTAKVLPQYANGTLGDYSNLGNLDVVTELPKLTVEQIALLIQKHFSKSGSVVKTSDAEGIFKAQNDSGISALAILGIGAFESGWGTSKIARDKGNLWGYGAVDSNPYGGAYNFGNNTGEAAQKYAANLLKDFYNGWGEKTIAEMGYNYATNKSWSSDVSSIMNTLKNTLVNSGMNEVYQSSLSNQGILSSMASDMSATAENTAALPKLDFKSEIKSLITGESNTASADDEQFQGELLNYIKESIDEAQKIDDTFAEKWEKLQAYQNEQSELFKDYDKRLMEAVGTDGFIALRGEITKATDDYVSAIMGMSAELGIEQVKAEFERAQEVQRTTLSYYNKKKSEGANADELKSIIEAYNEITNTVDEYNDNYVQQMESYTSYLVSTEERKLKTYDDEMSWLDKSNEKLQKQYEEENDALEKTKLGNELTDGYNKSIESLNNKKNTAHQSVLDLYNNEMYKPVLERFDIESWYDANGDATAQFEKDIERMAVAMPELVPIMQQVFELVQKDKKVWYEASETIDDYADSISKLQDDAAIRKVEKYIELQERLADVLTYQKDMNDAVTAASQSHNSLSQGLRNELTNAKRDLESAMRLEDWLDPKTRRQLFNKDDYDAEVKAINEIQAEADRLYKNYRRDINKLKEEDKWQEAGITAEYNKQMEALNERLEVSKQELDIAKKRDALENAMKERDTQVIMGNKVVNIHDPEDAYNKTQERIDAENTKANTEITNAENEDVRNMQRVSDAYDKEIAAISNRIEMINEMDDDWKIKLADNIGTLEEFDAMLQTIIHANPYYITSTDNTRSLYNGLDMDKVSHGYDYNYDYKARIPVIETAIEEGVIDAVTGANILEALKADHDYKTTTDPHNAGYNIYNPYAEFLMGNKLMRMFEYNPEQAKILAEQAVTNILSGIAADKAIEAMQARYVGDNKTVVSGNVEIAGEHARRVATSNSAEKTVVNGTVEIAAKEKAVITSGGTVVSGNDLNQDDNIISFIPQGYKTVDLADYISMNGAFDFLQNGYNSIAKGILSSLVNVSLPEVKSGERDEITNYNFAGDIVIRNPVGNANDFANGLINEMKSEYSVTKNMR